MTKIVISACTYKRPDGLRDLFASLEGLDIPQGVEASVRIIDNDQEPSSQALVQELSGALSMPVDYVHETEAGIPPARNRALSEAASDDFLVFVDDDETVAPDWLTHLWAMQQKTGASFVQGPVIPTVENEKDSWWVKSDFFIQKIHKDGSARHESWTNNVMIDMRFIQDHNIRFDQALRYDGGSDTLFFQDIIRNGGSGVYAAKAIVYEIQPPSRLTWKWCLQRQFRYGTTRANCARLRSPLIKAGLNCFARSGACIALGLVKLPLTLIQGRVGLANSLALISRGAGVLMGFLGKRHLEYARDDASSGTDAS